MKYLAVVVAVAMGLFSATITADAQPKPELWPRWSAHDATSTQTLDHSAWDRWLAAYVTTDRNGVNRVAYGRVTPADRSVLESYVSALTAMRVTELNRSEQMALWINLYNALTVKVVLDHYPVRSIRDIAISPGWFASGPWGARLARVEGEEISLDDIEHRILRPIWRDARIHYAVNCASVGCPNLARRAYTGARLETMLDEAARAHVNNWRGAAVRDGGLHVSSLYKWYVEDFGGSEAAVLAHLRRYAASDLLRRLDGVTKISGYRYDWNLNQASE